VHIQLAIQQSFFDPDLDQEVSKEAFSEFMHAYMHSWLSFSLSILCIGTCALKGMDSILFQDFLVRGFQLMSSWKLWTWVTKVMCKKAGCNHFSYSCGGRVLATPCLRCAPFGPKMASETKCGSRSMVTGTLDAHQEHGTSHTKQGLGNMGTGFCCFEH